MYSIKDINYLILYQTVLGFNDSGKQPIENLVGKGENAGNAGNQHFLLFQPCFLPI